LEVSDQQENMKSKIVLYFLVALVSEIFAQSSCPGKPNLLPIDTSDPVFVSQVTNGKLFQAGSIQPQINVVHMYGSAYDVIISMSILHA
jgi:hypothetical protein